MRARIPNIRNVRDLSAHCVCRAGISPLITRVIVSTIKACKVSQQWSARSVAHTPVAAVVRSLFFARRTFRHRNSLPEAYNHPRASQHGKHTTISSLNNNMNNKRQKRPASFAFAETQLISRKFISLVRDDESECKRC